jgi:hypothetical protein
MIYTCAIQLPLLLLLYILSSLAAEPNIVQNPTRNDRSAGDYLCHYPSSARFGGMIMAERFGGSAVQFIRICCLLVSFSGAVSNADYKVAKSD